MCLGGNQPAPPPPAPIIVEAPKPTPEPPTLAQAAPAKAARAKQKARLKDPYADSEGGTRALRIARPKNAKVSAPQVNTSGGGMGVNTGSNK